MATNQERYIRPRVNVLADDQAITIEADVPGVTKEQTDVEVRDGQLVLKADRSTNGARGAYRLHERSTAGYYRVFSLSDTVDANKIEAQLTDGVLTIKLAKADRLKPRTVTVN